MLVEHRFIEANGLRLHALDFGGSGPPVVCMHGVTGQAWTWYGVAARLAGRRRVLAVDLRGHGDSQWSYAEAYETDDLVGDLRVALMTSPEPVDLVGASWGGLVALRLAATSPALVRRLVVVDAPPSYLEDVTAVPERPYEFASHAEAVTFERAENPRATAAMIDALALYGTRPAGGGRLLRKHDPAFCWRWPFRADDHWSDLAALAVPALLVRATESAVLAADVFERMGDVAPSARQVEVADSGHLVPVDNPAGLAVQLSAFLP